MKGWEVEWVRDVPRDSDGELDLDNADYQFRDFAERDAAIRFARDEALPKDYFGSVRVAPFEMVPYESGYPGLYREYTADAEYVD